MTFTSRDTGNEARQVGAGATKAQWQALGRPAAEKEAAIRDGNVGIIELLAAHCVGVGTGQRIKAALMC